MQDLDGTTRAPQNFRQVSQDLVISIFDGTREPYSIRLADFRKQEITFGRAQGNDVCLTSPLVSHQHGRLVLINGQWFIQDKAAYAGEASTNGLIYNNAAITSRMLNDGDFIRIDDGVETVENGVLFVFSGSESTNKWMTAPIAYDRPMTIGRAKDCYILLPHISVSKHHAKIVREQDGFYIYDTGSTNGVIVNNRRISGKVLLHEKDVIAITNSKLIFTSHAISFCYYRSGISVDASDVVIVRGKGKRAFTTSNHVSLSIKPGELVGIIGGSGAGKSTILNSMCGYLPPTEGNVYINGVDLYRNFDSLKKLIGYVPQSDIVYDNLTLHDMLMYTAKLRLPEDISEEEREATIDRAIAMVELPDKKNSLIKSLSGGQRKRASIAVELLSDPNLMFLDEPSSGLDPGTERNLMHSLRKMADNGKTVILVTHSTLQLKLCDKIVFMGRGGNLCFYGSHDDALRFFGVDDIVDVYNLINDEPAVWRDRYEKTVAPVGKTRANVGVSSHSKKENKLHQLGVLCARYTKLILNDRQRLLLLMAQAPILALLISFVANGDQYEYKIMTKSLMFALSCSAFWVGMLNSIQEICKERSVLKREYMTGLSLGSYISSKIIVLGIMSLIQSLMIVTVFSLTVGLPEKGVFIGAYLEMFISTFLTAISAASLGLLVSSLFTNPDRAMTVAPILLMPQILFSGTLFDLGDSIPMKVVSWFATCRWSVEGLGTIANLNDLPRTAKEAQAGLMPPPEDFYDYTVGHLVGTWGLLIFFSALFLVIAWLAIRRIGKEKS